MKKLIFSAFLAMAAISGAYAQNYWLTGATSTTPNFVCPGTAAACSIKYNLSGTTVIYSVPNTPAGNQTPENRTTLGAVFYNP